MARVRRTTVVPGTVESVFDYLADFSTTREWDPGIVDAEKLTEGPPIVGSKFRVVARFMGRDVELVYTTTEYERPERFTVDGRNATSRSVDTITFAEDASGGTRITYEAELTLKGPLALFDPALRVVFERLADKAIAGLEATLGEKQGVA